MEEKTCTINFSLKLFYNSIDDFWQLVVESNDFDISARIDDVSNQQISNIFRIYKNCYNAKVEDSGCLTIFELNNNATIWELINEKDRILQFDGKLKNACAELMNNIKYEVSEIIENLEKINNGENWV